MTKSDIKVLLLICVMFPCFILGMIFVAVTVSFVSGIDAVKSWIKPGDEPVKLRPLRKGLKYGKKEKNL